MAQSDVEDDPRLMRSGLGSMENQRQILRAARFGPLTTALYGTQDIHGFFERAIESLAGECCPWHPDELRMLEEDDRYEACQMGEEFGAQ